MNGSFLHRAFKCDYEEPVKLKKHKVIAQAFAKRKTFNNAGRLSISFRNTHEDPVGVNFNLDSVESQDFSSAWAAALPKLVVRRDALVRPRLSSVSGEGSDSVSSNSEISISVKRVSVESRRNSIDSQISVQYAEVKATRKVPRSRSRRTKRRRYGSKSKTSKIGPVLGRGSTTSQESQWGVQVLTALASGGVPMISQVPNMKRRSAITGLDDKLLSKITDDKNPGVLLPFFFPACSGSEDNLSSVDKLALDEEANKHKDVEAGRVEKDESESEDSQPEETTRINLTEQEPRERSRSKTSNKSSKSHTHENGKRNRDRPKSKYSLSSNPQDETVLKHLLENTIDANVENEKESLKDTYRKTCLGDLASSLTEYCPELCRIMRSDLEKNAREISTQTSLPLDILEMEELKQSIDEIINSRNCSSKGTQISPKLNKTNTRRNDDTYRWTISYPSILFL